MSEVIQNADELAAALDGIFDGILWHGPQAAMPLGRMLIPDVERFAPAEDTGGGVVNRIVDTPAGRCVVLCEDALAFYRDRFGYEAGEPEAVVLRPEVA